MKRILKTSLLVLAVLALFLSAASAEGVVLSEREKAIRLADQALEEKYGITQLTQEYFDRVTEYWEGDIYIVRYQGTDFWGYALGTYEVMVEDGTVTGVTWSHDGEDTSGGLEADAWGSGQILEILRLNQETGDLSLFEDRLEEINDKYGYVVDRDAVSDTRMVMRETNSEEARNQAVLTEKQMNAIAMQAVTEVYELTDGQAAHMEVLSEPDEEASWYTMLHGEPCLTVCIGVGDDEEEPGMFSSGIAYTEKDGTYWVCVNVKTGVVEEIFYSSGIGGNG